MAHAALGGSSTTKIGREKNRSNRANAHSRAGQRDGSGWPLTMPQCPCFVRMQFPVVSHQATLNVVHDLVCHCTASLQCTTVCKRMAFTTCPVCRIAISWQARLHIVHHGASKFGLHHTYQQHSNGSNLPSIPRGKLSGAHRVRTDTLATDIKGMIHAHTRNSRVAQKGQRRLREEYRTSIEAHSASRARSWHLHTPGLMEKRLAAASA